MTDDQADRLRLECLARKRAAFEAFMAESRSRIPGQSEEFWEGFSAAAQAMLEASIELAIQQQQTAENAVIDALREAATD